MKSLFQRGISVLLVCSLWADPLTAGEIGRCFISPHSSTVESLLSRNQSPFTQSALRPFLAWYSWPAMFRRPAARAIRQIDGKISPPAEGPAGPAQSPESSGPSAKKPQRGQGTLLQAFKDWLKLNPKGEDIALTIPQFIKSAGALGRTITPGVASNELYGLYKLRILERKENADRVYEYQLAPWLANALQIDAGLAERLLDLVEKGVLNGLKFSRWKEIRRAKAEEARQEIQDAATVYTFRGRANRTQVLFSVRGDEAGQPPINGRTRFGRADYQLFEVNEEGRETPMDWGNQHKKFKWPYEKHVDNLKDQIGERSFFTVPMANLYMDDHTVYFQKGTIYYQRGEPVEQRTYTSLVKWKNGRVTIEPVKYRRGVKGESQDAILNGRGKPITDHVEWAVYGRQILQGKQETRLTKKLYREFDDLAHLFRFPLVNHPQKPFVMMEFGLPELYRQENRAMVRRLLQEPEGGAVPIPLGDVPQIELVEALAQEGYQEKTQDGSLARGEYRFLSQKGKAIVEINYKRAHYTHNLIGFTADGDYLVMATAAHGKNDIGVTIEEVARKMKAQGAVDVLLVSSGSDVNITQGTIREGQWVRQPVARSVEGANTSKCSAMLVFAIDLSEEKELAKLIHLRPGAQMAFTLLLSQGEEPLIREAVVRLILGHRDLNEAVSGRKQYTPASVTSEKIRLWINTLLESGHLDRAEAVHFLRDLRMCFVAHVLADIHASGDRHLSVEGIGKMRTAAKEIFDSLISEFLAGSTRSHSQGQRQLPANA